MRWVADIKGALTLDVLAEYLGLWDLLAERVLQPDVEDSHILKFSASGQYSAKSAYDAMFIGAIQFQPWERIWKSWPRVNANFLCGWLLTTGAGRLIGLLKMVWHIQRNAPCVIRKRKL